MSSARAELPRTLPDAVRVFYRHWSPRILTVIVVLWTENWRLFRPQHQDPVR